MADLTIDESLKVLDHVRFVRWLGQRKDIFLTRYVTLENHEAHFVEKIDDDTVRKLAVEFVEGEK